MGYYADGNGTIQFTRELSAEEKSRLEKIVEYEWDYDIDSILDSPLKQVCTDRMRTTGISLWTGEKYHDDSVRQALQDIADNFPVAEGEIEYIGEDNCIWRFIYKNGRFVCQNGRVVYDEDDDY